MTKQSTRTHCVLLFIDRNTTVYFDSFGTEYIPQELSNKINEKSITHNIFRVLSNEPMKSGFYCMTFMEYVIAGKFLLDYTNLFPFNDFQKNNEIILKFYKVKYDKRKRKP